MNGLVGWAALALAAEGLAVAGPVEVRLHVTGGTLAVGERGSVSVVVLKDGRPIRGVLERNDGVSVTTIGDGRYITEAIRTGDSWTFSGVFDTGGERTPVEAELRLPPSGGVLEWPDRMVATAGTSDVVPLELAWPAQGTVDDIWVATGAGRVDFLRLEGSELKVGVAVTPDPFPRAIPLLALDASIPGSAPALGVLELRARTQIPVRTSPGTVATLEVGGRTLPPVTADEAGLALISARIRPGETTARLKLDDPAGNSNTTTIRLGGDPRPHLVGIAVAGQAGERDPGVVVAATSPSGEPWSGDPPRCSTPRGAEVMLHAVTPGVWRGPLSDDDLLLGTIECHLGVEAQSVLRLPRPVTRPDRLVLRVSPAELDGRSPQATIRAWVVDPQGDRLPVTAPGVQVEYGRFVGRSDSASKGLVSLQYDGTDAVARGSETVTARWAAPQGSGPIRDLELRWGGQSGGQISVFGRALDRLGQPLDGVGLVFESGGGSVDGRPIGHGWSTASLPAASEVEWVTVRGVQSGRSIGAWVSVDDPPMAPPDEFDLFEVVQVPVFTGPVRQVGLQVNPSTLVTADARTAAVILELRDGNGSAVTDLPVELSASRGTLSAPRLRADGRLEATYTPPRPGDIGRIEVRASSPTDQFPTTVTELELVSEDLRRAPALHLGWLAGAGGVSSPWVSMDGEIPLAVLPDTVRLSLSAGLYGLRSATVDPTTGEELAVSAEMVPLGVGLTTRQPRRRFVTRAGASVLAVPYWVRVSVDASQGLRGMALAPPGAHAHAGLGLRTRQGEVDLSMGYLFVTTRAGDGGWQGLAGGLLTTVGYRHGF